MYPVFCYFIVLVLYIPVPCMHLSLDISYYLVVSKYNYVPLACIYHRVTVYLGVGVGVQFDFSIQ